MILLDLTLGQAIIVFVVGTVLIMGSCILCIIMIKNRKTSTVIKDSPPINIELVDVLYHSSIDTNNINSKNIKYLVRSINDNKFYLIDECNLHAEPEINTVTKDSFKVRINVFSTNQKIGVARNDNVVNFGIKGIMYAKKIEDFNDINSGKWIINKLKNTHYDGEKICATIGEDKKVKDLFSAKLWYSFNEKVSFDVLRNMQYVHGYTEFDMPNI